MIEKYKEIVFITDKIDKFPSPNGICVLSLVDKLSQVTNIHIISINEDKDEIIRTTKYVNYKIKKELNPYKEFSFGKKIIKFLTFYKYPFPNKNVIKKINSTFETNILKKSQVLVISTCNPSEAIFASLSIKRKYQCKSVLYNLDALQNSFSPTKRFGFILSKYVEYIEKKWFSYFDKIILMRGHQKLYQNISEMFSDKIVYSDYPVYIPEKSQKKVKKTTYDLVYMGSLYKEIREPLDTLRLAAQLSNFKFLFITNDQFDDEFNIFMSCNKNIRKIPLIMKSKVESVILSTGILINIGNMKNSMIPSKIFEYMSYGIPILNLYSTDDDYSLSYFSKYPYVLSIKSKSEYDKNLLENVTLFIQSNKGLKLEYDILKGLFLENQPRFTTDILIKFLKEYY